MPEVTVVENAVSYTYWDERTRTNVYVSVKRGEAANIPDEALAHYERAAERELADHRAGRLVGANAGHPRVLSAAEFEAWQHNEALKSDPVYKLNDEELMALTAEGLLAELNSTDGLAVRVLPLEQARKYTRKTIITHCERLMVAVDGGDVSLAPAEDLTPLFSPNA